MSTCTLPGECATSPSPWCDLGCELVGKVFKWHPAGGCSAIPYAVFVYEGGKQLGAFFRKKAKEDGSVFLIERCIGA